ncbi:MAG TPA: glycoside hydrolase family 15 protein [bacterium]|nr:glycoside hydrolase family 15 protein [bacterium]
MPRDLPIGNGTMQINFDLQHRLVDLYYPYVGGENHLVGHQCRLGLWVDGRFAWVGDEGWQGTFKYLPETLVTDVRLEHAGLGIRLTLQECVDFHINAFVRRITIGNTAPGPREVRVFCHHDLDISGTAYGDTAYYDPTSKGLFHYKGLRWFHANVLSPTGHGWGQYAVGISEWQQREGTWRDAEDGVLGMNPIAQGSVDSTGGISLTVPGSGEQVAYHWLLVGNAYEEVRGLNQFVLARTPEALLKRTRDYWTLWVNKEARDFGPLPPDVVERFKQSLLITRTQIDNRGAIIASTDSDILRLGRDTYGYMWPRDGALVAQTLDMAGYNDLTRPFYRFCAAVMTREGFLLHKYNPDRSVGSSWHPWILNNTRQFPIQEDETALVVWALGLHFAANRDVEFIKPLYRPLIKAAADFLAEFRDPATGLPRPSYDLWEERHGVHAFTCGSVYGGLEAAADLAAAFGETDHAARYRTAADAVRAGVLAHLWSAEANRFARTLVPGTSGETLDLTIDASLYGLFAFGMLEPDDPKLVSTMQAVETRLRIQTGVGGIARYEDDYYQQISKETGPVPGNPWILCTLWLAEWYVARAKSIEHLAHPLELIRWAASRALPSGVMPEQVHPHDGTPLSVSPLTWSHASFAHAVLCYLDCLYALDVCPTCGSPKYRRVESRIIGARAASPAPPGEPSPAPPRRP